MTGESDLSLEIFIKKWTKKTEESQSVIAVLTFIPSKIAREQKKARINKKRMVFDRSYNSCSSFDIPIMLLNLISHVDNCLSCPIPSLNSQTPLRYANLPYCNLMKPILVEQLPDFP